MGVPSAAYDASAWRLKVSTVAMEIECSNRILETGMKHERGRKRLKRTYDDDMPLAVEFNGHIEGEE
jgi:hypothetical protein